MNLDRATERAGRIRGPQAAARLYADIESELAMGDPTAEQEHAGEDALRQLEGRFPGVKDRSADVVAYGGHIPNLSRRAKDNLDREDGIDPNEMRRRVRGQHSGGGSGSQRRRGGHGQRRPQQPKPKTQPHRPARKTPTVGSHVRQAAGERFAQTGIPAASESTSRFIMRTLGGIAGLSFLVLLLKPNGVRALQVGSNGLVYALQALASPHVDPLHPPKPTARAPGSTLGPIFTPSDLRLAPTPARSGAPYGVTHPLAPVVPSGTVTNPFKSNVIKQPVLAGH